MTVRVCAGLALLLVLLRPEHAEGGASLVASKAALASPSPAATTIGATLLARGDSAIDVAVAVGFALAVTRPQTCGLGGGGVLVYYDATSRGVWVLDFRVAAPFDPLAKEKKGAERPASAKPIIATPALTAGLEAAHERFGHLPWKDLVTPAARLARDGFVVDPELAADLASARQAIERTPSTASVLLIKGATPAAGQTWTQHDLASTLERIAKRGASELTAGTTSKRILEKSRKLGSSLGLRDLRAYRATWLAPLVLRFRGYEIYAPPPPVGGGGVLAEMAAILAPWNLAEQGFGTLRSVHLVAEAERRAQLDWNRLVSSGSAPSISVSEMLSEERAESLRTTIANDRATPGSSLGDVSAGPASPAAVHVAIADAAGNMVTMALSLGGDLGSGVVADGTGILLAAIPPVGALDRVAPGGRGASLLTPTIVLKDGTPFAALGTGGGRAEPVTVLQILLGTIVHGRTLTDVVAAPRYHHQGLPDEIVYEEGRAPMPLIGALTEMGHAVRRGPAIGDVQIVLKDGQNLQAVADNRHVGDASGH